MIYPNKTIKVEDSIIYKTTFLLDHKNEKEQSIFQLWMKVKNEYDNIDEYIYALDILYALDMIDINWNKETIVYYA